MTILSQNDRRIKNR